MRKWQDFINQAQLDWVNRQLERYDVIVTSLHGSMLYGLERKGSDVDIKAVYLPSFQDLLLGESCKTLNKKCDHLDVEIEIKSLHSFLKSAKSCDTNCIDMLWTPDKMLLKNTPTWDCIRYHRQELLSKNMKGLVGYIKTHTHKYSNKIQRYQELVSLKSEISFIDDSVKLSDTCLPEIIDRNKYKYIKTVTMVSDHEQQYLEVCGKKYILSWECKLLKEALEKEIDRYGKRTKDGDSKGLDVKSLSHALRVLYQLKELVETRDLVFPLKDSEYIKDVKTGKISDESKVIDKIDALFEECTKLLDSSDLPEESSIDSMLKVLKENYRGN